MLVAPLRSFPETERVVERLAAGLAAGHGMSPAPRRLFPRRRIGQGSQAAVFQTGDPTLVLKRFHHHDSTWCYGVVRAGAEHLGGTQGLMRAFHSRSDAEAYRARAARRGVRAAIRRVTSWVTPRRVLLAEGYNEAIVGAAVGAYVGRRCPSFLRTHAAVRDRKGRLGLVLDRAQGTLAQLVRAGGITPADLESIVVQVFVALAAAQRLVRFKHHDLHTENVFLDRRPRARDSTATTPGPKVLPEALRAAWGRSRWRVRIGDFGFASVEPWARRRYARVDMPAFQGTGRTNSGPYRATLEGFHGYDGQVFLDSLLGDLEEAGLGPDPLVVWLRGLHGGRTTRARRPAHGHVSDVPATRVVAKLAQRLKPTTPRPGNDPGPVDGVPEPRRGPEPGRRAADAARGGKRRKGRRRTRPEGP